MLGRADETLERIGLNPRDEQFGHGEMLRFFLEVEAGLLALMPEGSGAEALNAQVMAALFGGRDPVFLRAAVLKVLAICRALKACPHPSIPDLPTIGNPIGTAVVEALLHLRDWFGFLPFVFS
jgi:hypothetical protein